MRISTPQIFRQGTDAMLDQQSRVSTTQLQLSTGKRILKPSDDPAASARALGLRDALSQVGQYQRNIDAARSRLELEETALVSIGNSVQRLQELAIRGQSGGLNDSDRASVALEVRELIAGLVQLGNTRDANSEYLFAGYQSRTEPFATSAGGFVYNGDQGQRFVEIGPGRQLATGDSGAAVFLGLRSGNGTFAVDANPANTGTGLMAAGTVTDPSAWIPDSYTLTFTTSTTWEVRDSGSVLVASGNYTDGAAINFLGIQTSVSGTPASGDRFTISASSSQSVFEAAQKLATALETVTTGNADRVQVVQDINNSIGELGGVLDRILEVRARVGARLNTLDGQQQTNEDLELRTSEVLSGLEDLDYAEAITRFNQQLTALQAAQQSFARVQGLSLFNFL